MLTVAQLSPGVLMSPLGSEVIAYDLVTETAHRLNRSAGALLASCDGATTANLIARCATAAGTTAAAITTDVETALAQFSKAGLLNRSDDYTTPRRPRGSTKPDLVGASAGLQHQVLGWSIRFRSTDGELLTVVDDHLGTGVADAPGTPLTIDIETEADDELVVTAESEWRFPNLGSMLSQLVAVINEYAVDNHEYLSLHAGGVRSPEGAVLLILGESGAGRSTLTGAFVKAGWGYLGDEAVGVLTGSRTAVGYPKRMAIDDQSREVLGLPHGPSTDVDPADLSPAVPRLTGEVAPVDWILLPRYTPDAPLHVEVLTQDQAFKSILANAFNLGRSAGAALDAVCDLASPAQGRAVVSLLAHGLGRDIVDPDLLPPTSPLAGQVEGHRGLRLVNGGSQNRLAPPVAEATHDGRSVNGRIRQISRHVPQAVGARRR